MNGRIKPMSEDVASAALNKPKIVDLSRVSREPNDHTQVLAGFRNISKLVMRLLAVLVVIGYFKRLEYTLEGLPERGE